MSSKISSKNLSYNDSLPPFLAALRAQASGATGPSPLLAAQRRTAKKRSASEEAEDQPLVVDENGNTIELSTDKDGLVTAGGSHGNSDSTAKEGEETIEGGKADSKPSEESKSAIGGAAGKRRRKIGRVIGQDADETTADVTKKVNHEDDEGRHKGKDDKEGSDSKSSNKMKSSKGRAKKIKLSFDDGEG